MSINEDLIKEYKDSEVKELKKREKSINEGEKLDQIIRKRMEKGEIGISNGFDNQVAIVMFAVATLFTLLALYFIFGVKPDHYQI